MTPSAERSVRLLLTAALAAAAMFPAGYLLAAALPILTQGGWLAHFASTTLPDQAWNSGVVALQASAVAFALGAVPAVLVSRFEFTGRRLVTVFALLPLLFAPSVTASIWMIRSSADFFSSRAALALHLGVTSAPYVFVVFRVAASRMPHAFAELAAVLGCDFRQRLLRVHLPGYAVPAAAALMIVFAQSIGDYATAERLGIQTLSVGMLNLWLSSQSSQVAAIVSTVMIVPTVLLVLAAAWVSTSLMSQNPVPPAAAAASRRRLAGLPAAAILAWSSLGAIAFAWTEWYTVQWAIARWARTRFAAIPGDTADTAITGLVVVAVVAAFCLLTAVILRTGGRSAAAERMPWLFLANYFLPSLVLALAFVMMSRDGSVAAQWLGSLRDTRLLIVVPDVLRFMPFALLPVLDALRRTPPAMIEAARGFGRGALAARAVAFRGHLLPALALGCGLVFMECVKELDLSLTLQPFGYSTLALKIYAFSRHQNMDRAAVWVLISQALMLAPLLLLWWRMDRLDVGRRN
ncbi:MAG: iron ABC transporter permease [Rubrivivax sp.]|nr:iron ABC transporter permease [Rubrivivax sp.]